MDYNKFMVWIEKKYGTCSKCGRKMEHQKEIHTFVCSCGNRDWYVERLGDSASPQQKPKGGG